MPKRRRGSNANTNLANQRQRVRPPATAQSCLEYVAQLTKPNRGQTISLAHQNDQALVWKAVAVHPMQALENAYQGIVHDAVRGVTDSDQRKEVESRAMDGFFLFDAGAVQLLGVPRGGSYQGQAFPLMEQRLRHAIKALEVLTERSLVQGDPQTAGQALLAILGELNAVLASFFTIAGSAQWSVPYLDSATRALAGLAPVIRAATTWQALDPPWRRLENGAAELRQAFDASVAAVQMFYSIEGFYLFRLLVRFRIESADVIRPQDAIGASKQLTALLATDHPWLAVWLRDKLLQLKALVASADPSGNTLFFLKGGRAIKYLEGLGEAGENDWDTQIVINPTLPAAQWYALFQKVQNTVLLALQRFKRELYVLMQHRAQLFQDELDRVTPPLAVVPDPGPAPPDVNGPLDDDEDIPERYRLNTKAELIDVGLPRNDTVEAMEQWMQLNGKLLVATDGMPYPGYLYYIDEYLSLAREVFAQVSPSMDKSAARIARLCAILSLPDAGLAATVEEEVAHIRAAGLTRSLATIAQINDQAVRRAVSCILSQFCRAYDLGQDTNLARGFDDFFADNLANVDALVVFPAGLTDSIQDYIKKKPWTAQCEQTAKAVGYAHWISRQMAAHLRLRGAFLQQEDAALGDFVHALYSASVFSPGEELSAQIALTGSYAAFLHADYSRFARPDEIEPVATISLQLFANDPAADPATLMELVSPLVTQYLQDHPGVFEAVLPTTPAEPLRLFWHSPVAIAPFTYAPLVITISVAKPGLWPLLAFIWDYPALSLRDLILDYRARSALITEYGTRAQLKATTAALTEILLRAENPEPPAAPFGRHLMISSEAMAIGPHAYYPPSYHREHIAYQRIMTGNREALRQALTLPPSAEDRTLDLLVLNQDHGGIVGNAGQFGQWSAADLQTYLVDPMLRSGLRARIVVLDFCVSTALLPTFAALCTADGALYSNLYSISEVIVDREFWEKIKGALARRDRNAVAADLTDQMSLITRGVTGLSHLPNVQPWDAPRVAAYLTNHPGDLDVVSAFFTFWAIGQIFDTAYGSPQSIYDRLVALIAGTPARLIGPAESAILGYVPNDFAAFDRAQVQALATARAMELLSHPQYQIQRPPPANIPFQQLWQAFKPFRANLLALFTGLTPCPTPYAVYEANGRDLTLDSALSTAPIEAEASERINIIHYESTDDVEAVLAILQSDAGMAVVRGLVSQDDYLQ